MVKDFTIIVPVYNEENNISIFYDCVNDVFKKSNFDNQFNFLFVNDGSSDSTLKKITNLSDIDSRVKYISLSKNFGKEAAIYAGLDYAHNQIKSSYYVLMDVDLQDPPEIIPQMIDIMNNTNCDCVCSRRKNRKGDPKIRSFFSNMFYGIINKVSRINIKAGTRDFRFMNKKYVNAVLSCREYHRFFKGISS